MSAVPAPTTLLRTVRELTVADVAALIDAPLYAPYLTPDDIAAGCQEAASLGLASVLCRPEHVALAARTLRGSPVQVTTAVGLRREGERRPGTTQVLLEADAALSRGADVLALIASHDRLTPYGARNLAREVTALAKLTAAAGGLTNVVLPASRITRESLVEACRLSIGSGAGMVQGGLWFSADHASLTQISVMRRAIGPEALLKWTTSMASLDRLLLAHGEGVDRFNADISTVLDEARDRQHRLGHIRVPVPGLDY